MQFGLIFDCDGVLADTEPLICEGTMAMFRELYHCEMQPEDFTPFVGRGPILYTAGPAEKYGLVIDLDRAVQRRQELFVELLHDGRWIGFPGTNTLIEAASDSSEWKLAIATSSSMEKSTASMCAAGVPIERFDAHVVGEMVENKKPHPDIYLLAASRIGIAPERCVGIEDSISGVAAVKAAGMSCIAVTNTFRREELDQADLVVAELTSLTLDTLRELVGAAKPA